jgi:hypothetical protein
MAPQCDTCLFWLHTQQKLDMAKCMKNGTQTHWSHSCGEYANRVQEFQEPPKEEWSVKKLPRISHDSVSGTEPPKHNIVVNIRVDRDALLEHVERFVKEFCQRQAREIRDEMARQAEEVFSRSEARRENFLRAYGGGRGGGKTFALNTAIQSLNAPRTFLEKFGGPVNLDTIHITAERAQELTERFQSTYATFREWLREQKCEPYFVSELSAGLSVDAPTYTGVKLDAEVVDQVFGADESRVMTEEDWERARAYFQKREEE